MSQYEEPKNAYRSFPSSERKWYLRNQKIPFANSKAELPAQHAERKPTNSERVKSTLLYTIILLLLVKALLRVLDSCESCPTDSDGTSIFTLELEAILLWLSWFTGGRFVTLADFLICPLLSSPDESSCLSDCLMPEAEAGLLCFVVDLSAVLVGSSML